MRTESASGLDNYVQPRTNRRLLHALAMGMLLLPTSACGAAGREGDSSTPACFNPLHGKFELTIAKGAAIRETNHRAADPSVYLLDRPAKDTSFEAGNRGRLVTVCISENTGDGTVWAGFDAQELGGLTHTNLDNDDNGRVWVNSVNITGLPQTTK
ncbi:hypothetical protein H7097_03700 [Aeromicrobium sp.]|nr:hypothetical protein [Candidatus Saccharibacteria bacterium]